MRKSLQAVLGIAALAAAYGLGRHHVAPRLDKPTTRQVLYYVDPMHPSYKSAKPGIAPDCGMELQPVYADNAAATPSAVSAQNLPAGVVNIDGGMQKLLGVRVSEVEKAGSKVTVRAVGRVAPEDTKIYRINLGAEGFIRETHNDAVGDLVKKDQKLATAYSPEFLAATSGFLAATERVPGSVGKDGAKFTPNFPGAVAKEGVRSIQGYTDHLRNLGMSDVQIRQIADSRQLPDSVDIVSPTDGVILARSITAGEHFQPAMEFYRVADLSRVWVVAEVPAADAVDLRPGSTAQITLRDEGRRLAARITDSLPQSEAGGGTVKIRLEVDNPNYLLRPERLVDVEFPVRLPAAITVPADALVDSGAGARIYVERSEGIFEPRSVETGRRFGDRVEITHGVRAGERVVAAATFLVDSESRLEAATPPPAAEQLARGTAASARATTMATAKPEKDPICGMSVDPSKAQAAGNILDYQGKLYYFCSREDKQAFQNKLQSNLVSSLRKHQGD